MGFQKQWINQVTQQPKMASDSFTTFRFPRKDRDWEVGEVIQIVMNPRTKKRIPLGEAMIVTKEPRSLIGGKAHSITNDEARLDGFRLATELVDFLLKGKPIQYWASHPNRLTLRWLKRYEQPIA